MALKANYKDDGFVGNRKYRMVTNADNTVSFEDVTAYNPVGDSFGALDINTTNGEINRIIRNLVVTLSAAGWSASAPYTQTVNVAGITASDNPVVSLYLPEGVTSADVKLQIKAYGCVDKGVTGAGTITFRCYNKKPTVDFPVAVKGV